MPEWPLVRMGELVDSGLLLISDGYRARNEELGNEGTPFVRGGDIGNGWIETGTIDHVRPEFSTRIDRKLSKAGDVAFITKGTVGRAGLIRAGQPTVVFAPQIAYWRSLDALRLDQVFLYYLIISPDFRNSLDAVKTHGSMVADYVSISQQYDFRLPLPPAQTQRAIASVLGALDDKIDLNRRVNDTLETMAQAIFKDWFIDFGPTHSKMEGRTPYLSSDVWSLFPGRLDGEGNPEGWSIEALSSVTDLVRTSINPALHPTEMFDHYSIPAYDSGKNPTREIGRGILSNKTAIPNGAVLLSKLNPDISRIWLVDTDPTIRAVGSTEFLVFLPSRAWNRAFLYCSLTDHGFGTRIQAMVTGTSKSHQRVSPHSVMGMPIVTATQFVRQAFSHAVLQILEKGTQNRHESRILAATRDLLLPKLMSGEICIKDAEKVVETVL